MKRKSLEFAGEKLSKQSYRDREVHGLLKQIGVALFGSSPTDKEERPGKGG